MINKQAVESRKFDAKRVFKIERIVFDKTQNKNNVIVTVILLYVNIKPFIKATIQFFEDKNKAGKQNIVEKEKNKYALTKRKLQADNFTTSF